MGGWLRDDKLSRVSETGYLIGYVPADYLVPISPENLELEKERRNPYKYVDILDGVHSGKTGVIMETKDGKYNVLLHGEERKRVLIRNEWVDFSKMTKERREKIRIEQSQTPQKW